MAQTYLMFDFGTDEAKVQQARHKLDSWRQAFRLDKKLQFKFDRGEGSPPEEAVDAAKPASEAPKSNAAKPKSKSKPAEAHTAAQNSAVKLLVRLYFSPHEKLSQQRWIDRIPTEEPFKSATVKVIPEDAPEFADTVSKFDSLD
jgi:hypothetical protein